MNVRLFNYIRRGCILCLLFLLCCVPLDKVYADSLTRPSGKEFWNMFETSIKINWNNDDVKGDYIDRILRERNFDNNLSGWVFFVGRYDNTIRPLIVPLKGNIASESVTKEYCKKHGYTFFYECLFVDNGRLYMCNGADSSSSLIGIAPFYVVDHTYYTYSSSSTIYNLYTDVLSVDSIIASSFDSSDLSYDSTIGALSNPIMKSYNNLVDVTTIHSQVVDYFQWGDLTDTQVDFDNVEGYILVLKDGVKTKQIQLQLGDVVSYKLKWGNVFDLSIIEDWFICPYTYQLWLRPCKGGKCGDWVVWCSDSLTNLDRLNNKVITATRTTVKGNVEPSVDIPTSNYVVYVPSHQSNQVLSDDDITNIFNNMGDSGDSYSNVINNYNTSEESDGSFIDTLNDFKNLFLGFISFLKKLLVVLLSFFTFIPEWVRNLIILSVVAFVVIQIFKIIRG